MSDLAHFFGGDLKINAGGDLALVSGADGAIQRVIRRLLTNPGDYIWDPTYGAGLRRMIGQTPTIQTVQGVIKAQLFMESAVAQTPAPDIRVTPQPNGVYGVEINYTDANTGAPMLVTFEVKP